MAFCTNCGVKLDEGQRFCHNCGIPVAATVKTFCANCCLQLSEGQRFCHNCGQPATVVQSQGVQQSALYHPVYQQTQHQSVAQPLCETSDFNYKNAVKLGKVAGGIILNLIKDDDDDDD